MKTVIFSAEEEDAGAANSAEVTGAAQNVHYQKQSKRRRLMPQHLVYGLFVILVSLTG